MSLLVLDRVVTHRVCICLVGVLIAASAEGAPSAVSQNVSASSALKTSTTAARNVQNRTLVYSRVVVRDEAERQMLRRFGTVVDEHGRFMTVASSLEELHLLETTSLLETSVLDSTLQIRGLRFDPREGNPAQRLAGRGGYMSSPQPDGDYYLVQLFCPAGDDTLRRIGAAGGEVVQYVPHQTFLVFATSAAIESITRMPQVRWVGLHQPLFKVPAELLWCFGAPALRQQSWPLAYYGRTGPACYQVVVPRRASLIGIQTQLTQLGIRVKRTIKVPGNSPNVILAELNPAQVKAAVRLREVMAIEPVYGYGPEDERSDQITAGNFTSTTALVGPGYDPLTQFGVDGTGVTVGVVDSGITIPAAGGFYLTAANTVDGPLRGTNPGSYAGHGELVGSIIAGAQPYGPLDPAGYNCGLGVAPRVHLISIPFTRQLPAYSGPDQYTNTFADVVNDIVSTQGPNGSKGFIANNSWSIRDSGGNPVFNNNGYGLPESQYDAFVQDASYASSLDPMVIVFSAGNYGAEGLTRPKTCKNVITVAACKNLRLELDSSLNNFDDVSAFSSRGPTADGRIKPDLTAPGEGIAGPQPWLAFTPVGGGSVIDSYHWYWSGTSFAAPHVCGAAALFTQFWKAGRGGLYPSPALVKAALINGAETMHGIGASDPIPSSSQGWGRLNLKNVLNTGVPMWYRDQVDPLTDIGQEVTLTGQVGSGAHPLRVTLVWTDPPASPLVGEGPTLVNDLDLEVVVNGLTYRGNVLSNGLSVSGGQADTRNNVENVFLPAGIAAGTPIAIRVRASALNGDGILSAADPTDQHFALVVYNAAEASVPVISVASTSVTDENCLPTNGQIDPGETVTLQVSLQNAGVVDVANIVATVEASAGITPLTSQEVYGPLPGNGSSVSRPFTFRADGTCGDTLDLVIRLQDGAQDLGSIMLPIVLGAQRVALSEAFDGVTTPALPSGWTTSATGAHSAWATVQSSSDSVPNAAFAASAANTGESQLISPPLGIGSSSAQVSFRHKFNFEPTYDGGVLEISVDGGEFQDIVSAGGQFVTGGYNGTLSAAYGNPLAGRNAWTGNSFAYITTTVNLPPSPQGHTIRLSWRCGSDNGIAYVGWYVDSIRVTDGYECCGLSDLPPTVSSLETAPLPYLENQPPMSISGTLAVSDADNENLVGATVQLAMNYVAAEDLLGFTNQGGISGSFNSLNGMLTLSGTASVAAYEAALRSVTYANTSDNPSTLARWVRVVVSDGVWMSEAVSRQITVGRVNDPPSFVKGPDVTVAQNAGQQTVSPWATSINPGPGETSQAVDFEVRASRPYLFSVQPAIDRTGVLTFTPAPNLRGTNLVTVWLHDDGGTANGGRDTSETNTFTITVGRSQDSDTNGLPDDWEQIYFGGNTAVPGEDTDGDGFTNQQEFEAGTSPIDPADAPGITATEPSGTDVIVSFRTVWGRKYTVEYQEAHLSGPWTILASGLDGTGTVMQVVDLAAQSRPSRFYRVRVSP